MDKSNKQLEYDKIQSDKSVDNRTENIELSTLSTKKINFLINFTYPQLIHKVVNNKMWIIHF